MDIRAKLRQYGPGTLYAVALYLGVKLETGIVTVPILLAAGLYFGVQTFKRFQFINNIPTSTIRAAPMGNLVEITGKPTSDMEEQTAPDGTSCVFYQYELQEYQSSRNGGHWNTVATNRSTPYLTVTDDTGTLTLDTTQANLKLAEDTKEKLEKGRLTEEQRHILEENGYMDWGKEKKFLGLIPYRAGEKLRFVQYSVTPDETVYALGRIETDTVNGDEQPVMRRDTDNNVYIISDHSESELATKLQWYTLGHFTAAATGLAWGIIEFMIIYPII